MSIRFIFSTRTIVVYIIIYKRFVEESKHQTQILPLTFLNYRHINGEKIQLKDLILIQASDLFVKYIV